ncbi:DUF4311 domain-containing protein [Anaerotruncus colihominis]|uniref:EF_0832/AHA_3913 family protein n=1 Tax=Anaerotruncus colihominis DSM 17241 TaxID=445972 RepID=B0P5U6_9FIRM|nr:DUF4311 domain-containing protein [Anaerotruncus colihominis]EDS13103.1 EF_0832/AHA_3913 family protein [Anaerotruncus colihominis DSM 17241]UWN75679.1 DUF4311 domain-containing protein [Anaerotruncus colihominis]
MFFEVLIKSLIIGALGGAAVSAGAARMFHAPKVQAMGAFRTLGELNACKGDPVAHFSFGLGFFFNAAGAVIGAGALTQDVLHRIVPNWAASFLLVKNKNVEETLQDPAKMGVVGAVIGAITVALLNLIANAIPESLSIIASGILTPAANLMINTVMPIIFWLAALDAGKTTGIWGTILGGLGYLIMGNAVPGCVLGIIIGQSVKDNGYNKTVKIMLAVITALFIVIGIGRGFWGNLIAAFSNFLG